MKRFLFAALLLLPAPLSAQDRAPAAKDLAREVAPYLDEQLLKVGGVVLNAGHIMILGLVPLLVACLGVFLRSTLWGKMIRGAASNPEAARSMIDVLRAEPARRSRRRPSTRPSRERTKPGTS